MAEPDPLDDLRAQVRATQDAAERLMGGTVPPGGWEAPREDGPPFGGEVQQLAALLQSLRELLPVDLREQVTDLIRQLLLVLRALIDWWVARLEEHGGCGPEPPGGPGRDAAVEDIPIS